MQGQPDDQYQRRQGLHQQRGLLLRSAFAAFAGGVLGEHLAHRRRQLGAIAEAAALLQQHAGQQAGRQYRHGYRRDLAEELDEMPAGLVADQQVLRLSHQGADAAQRGADRRVHEQAAEEGAEFLEMGPVQLGDLAVGGGIVVLAGALPRSDPVIHGEECHRHADHHGGHGEGVEEGREEGGQQAEQER